MNFIDHTGHIFSLPSYSNFPAGYEYDEQPYIFWLNESNKLSVNNYYIKPIRILLDENLNENEELMEKIGSIITIAFIFSIIYNINIIRRKANENWN